MKITAFFLLVTALQVSAKGYGQVTLVEKNASLVTVFAKIKEQTGYLFVYGNDLPQKAKPVSISIQNASLPDVLHLVFKDQPFIYNIVEKTVVVTSKKEVNVSEELGALNPPIDIRGKVTDEKGNPVAGVTVSIKGSSKNVFTDENGEFSLNSVDKEAILIFTSVNMENFEVKVNGQAELTVTLRTKITELQDVVINKGYYSTSQKFNTGNVTKISGSDLQRQPITNVLSAIEGKVPGLLITQSGGLPGSPVKVQLRGQNSIGANVGILPDNNPLFIVDGVPFAPGNNDISLVNIASGGISPFSSINPMDIESIEVLKDADATSIYGSRGANGVVLITTKKGKAGKTNFAVNFYTGWSSPSKTTEWLNTEQYVKIRREALTNDGQPIDATTAPDLVSWDTTRYTDFKRLFSDETAKITNVQVSVSGGNVNTQFLISGNYSKETTLFPGNFADKKGSVHLNLNHASKDQRFKATVSVIYNSNTNNLVSTDLTGFLSLPPNLPALHDNNGKLNWIDNGVSFYNPLSYLLQTSKSTTDNLLGNLQLGYKIINDLNIKINMGYNNLTYNGYNTYPIAGQDPSSSPVGSSNFGTNLIKSWIVEPQLDYTKQIGRGKLNILVGSTWQQNTNNTSNVAATGFTSDALLQYQNAAASTMATNAYTQYNYDAVYGRINYNLSDKYLVNLTGRRDGSSRFGPNKQFGNFGAVGTGWIFSNEKFIQNHVRFLSFGKLRGSYGSTGNDQIGDYQYLDSWTSTQVAYDGSSGLTPTGLFNADYSWEINKKLEGALDLGFLKDRIFLSIACFRNRSSNQLISYALPNQTGFGSIRAKNFPALVQNTGIELSLETKNISTADFKWTSSFNLTIPKNKLISFPGLATSSYSKSLIEGQPLSFLQLYHYLGVDPATGLYQFEDVDKDGSISYPEDASVIKTTNPKFYGGFQNSVTYKGIQLDVFFQFVKQLGNSYLLSFYKQDNTVPGTMNNQPVQIWDRWQKPGDAATLQILTVTPGTDGFTALTNFVSSEGILTDASFIRLKNASLSYNLPKKIISRLHLENCRVYALGQNLLMITKYKNADPETQDLKRVAPLRTFTIGAQFNF